MISQQPQANSHEHSTTADLLERERQAFAVRRPSFISRIADGIRAAGGRIRDLRRSPRGITNIRYLDRFQESHDLQPGEYVIDIAPDRHEIDLLRGIGIGVMNLDPRSRTRDQIVSVTGWFGFAVKIENRDGVTDIVAREHLRVRKAVRYAK